MKISIKQGYQYMTIFLICQPHQIIFIHYKAELRQKFAACSGWDDNGKFRLERVNNSILLCCLDMLTL